MFRNKKDAKRFAASELSDVVQDSRQLRSSKSAQLFELNDKKQPVLAKCVNTRASESDVSAADDSDSAIADLFTLPLTPLSSDSNPPDSPEPVVFVHAPCFADSEDEMAESLGPPIFTGSREQDPKTWLSGLQNFIAYKGVDGDKKLALFKLRLGDTARDWLTSLPADKQNTFDNLSTAFLERFQPKELEKFRFAKELFNRKQQPGQSVDAFITELKVKADLVGMDAKSQLWAALNGLLPQIAAYVVEHSPESLHDVLQHARIAEMTRGTGTAQLDSSVSQQLAQLTEQMSMLSSKMSTMTTAAVSNDDRSSSGRHVSFRDQRPRSPSPFRAGDGARSPDRYSPRFARREDSSRSYEKYHNERRPANASPARSWQNRSEARGPPPQFFSGNRPQNQSETPVCSRCGQSNHKNPLFCPMRGQECYACHKIGHSYRCCKTKNQSAIRKF